MSSLSLPIPAKPLYFCGVCNPVMKCGNETSWLAHLQCNIHTAVSIDVLRTYGSLPVCDVCKAIFGNINLLEKHFLTDLHYANERKEGESRRLSSPIIAKQHNPPTSSSSSSSSSSSLTHMPTIMCSEKQAKRRQGVMHACLKSNESGVYECTLCIYHVYEKAKMKDHIDTDWHIQNVRYLCMYNESTKQLMEMEQSLYIYFDAMNRPSHTALYEMFVPFGKLLSIMIRVDHAWINWLDAAAPWNAFHYFNGLFLQQYKMRPSKPRPDYVQQLPMDTWHCDRRGCHFAVPIHCYDVVREHEKYHREADKAGDKKVTQDKDKKTSIQLSCDSSSSHNNNNKEWNVDQQQQYVARFGKSSSLSMLSPTVNISTYECIDDDGWYCASCSCYVPYDIDSLIRHLITRAHLALHPNEKNKESKNKEITETKDNMHICNVCDIHCHINDKAQWRRHTQSARHKGAVERIVHTNEQEEEEEEEYKDVNQEIYVYNDIHPRANEVQKMIAAGCMNVSDKHIQIKITALFLRYERGDTIQDNKIIMHKHYVTHMIINNNGQQLQRLLSVRPLYATTMLYRDRDRPLCIEAGKHKIVDLFICANKVGKYPIFMVFEFKSCLIVRKLEIEVIQAAKKQQTSPSASSLCSTNTTLFFRASLYHVLPDNNDE